MKAARVAGMLTRPSWRLSLPVCAAMVIGWGILRLAVFQDVVMPLTYALPLLICVWSRDLQQLWGMAALFAAMASTKLFWILPQGVFTTFEHWAIYSAQLTNIAVAGLVVHAIIGLRDSLERKNAALQALNQQLAEANDQVRSQNELLQRTNHQAEELSQQNEELRSQGEELEQQAEELTAHTEESQAVNEELAQREQMLRALLDAAGALSGDGEVLDAVCDQGLRLLGEHVQAAAIVEARQDLLHLHAQRGLKTDGSDAGCRPVAQSLAGLVIEQGRTAALDDLALRSDLVFPEPSTGPPFRSVLATPLRVDKQVVGAIEFYGLEARSWTDDQFRLAEWVAGQCGSVLQAVRLHAELQAREEKFRTLADNMSQFAWMADEHGGLFWYNRRWYDYTGTNFEEMQGWGWQKVHHPDHVQRVTEKFRHHVEAGEAWEDTFPLRGRDGNYCWFLSRALPIRDASGRILRWFGTNTDITQQRETEQRLAEAKEAAEAASRSQAQFLANMSHELRTPMNAILGMIDVALPKAVHPTAVDCLQTAKGSADLLLTLLDDLLDSSKIEAGKLELESAPFSLRRLMDQITRVLSVRASEKGLVFCCRFPEEVPDALVGDRMRLQQVLLNLAGNAIKFTEQGEVEISIRSLLVDGAAELEFAVRDTGIGIPPASLERIFQPFSQVDPSTTRRFGGTGLGLSISKNLVELMGGRIWAESNVGTGSTFYFTVRLSVANELPAEPLAPPVLSAAASALRILLAEDNPANQKLATYILKDRGHQVEIADDGHAAVYSAEQNDYDVILMDVQMPRMNGLEAAAAIRRREDGKREDGKRVPIIAMTAHAMQGDRERCLEAGMDAYLAKPINAQQMIALVESLANGPGAQSVRPISDSQRAKPASLVFDPDEARARCCDNREMLDEMTRCFFRDLDSLLPQMHAALANRDLAQLGRLGHRLKGTLVYLGARRATEAAVRVERLKRQPGGAEEAEHAVRTLERECAKLKSALAAYHAPTASSLAVESQPNASGRP